MLVGPCFATSVVTFVIEILAFVIQMSPDLKLGGEIVQNTTQTLEHVLLCIQRNQKITFFATFGSNARALQN